jgi:xanthine dehydrogenase accessory factor
VYDIAQQVRDWTAEGRDVAVAVTVATRGFSSREPAAAAAWSGAESVGPLAGLLRQPGRPGLVEATITDDDAHAAGLACGGVATLLVQPVDAYPTELWQRLIDHEPVCLVTTLDAAGRPDRTSVYTPQTIRDAAPPGEYGHPVPRLLGRGTTGAAVLDYAGQRLAAVALWPVPTLVVVGDGLIADALRRAGELLGWNAAITPQVDDAVTAIDGLHHSDAVVVLSHDRDVDGPALAAALRSGAGYVGGLGSRRTQQARREWLTAHGVDHAEQQRIHGPAGLDIDAHTPGEIAVSIVAEILAERSGSRGGSLRDRPGPVHTAGVNAPPPRY